MSTGPTICISTSIPARATCAQVLDAARIVRDALDALKHARLRQDDRLEGHPRLRPDRARAIQKDVWTFAKALAQELAGAASEAADADTASPTRPKGRVLVDYNQNAWGRTLASVYSVRPTPFAGVSTPVTWQEIDKGIRLEDFRLDNVRARFKKTGDLFKPLLLKTGRVDLRRYF